MATIAAFHSLSVICRTPSQVLSNPSSPSSSSSSLCRPIRVLHRHNYGLATSFKHLNTRKPTGMGKIRSVAEETLASEEQNTEETTSADQPVSVPVSPSDKLTMFFQADGTMDESAIPTVTKALETEGITNLNVQLLDGIASVELTKQTTIQATGVASGLVEIIQGSGFKLQTLNLSFQYEEDITS
ncbi:uncharacterized protein LOC131168001 isoform X2 [Malania oleifera]|uniref:uncharacterized protein LOC131168001 isoform X2 n=1 Tax=Malania oleifera TaxID=397392 RepID=UPI0025AE2C29|nr:uncharacterized protein LOC131168001 isoform X2 [Malania oleifera]